MSDLFYKGSMLTSAVGVGAGLLSLFVAPFMAPAAAVASIGYGVASAAVTHAALGGENRERAYRTPTRNNEFTFAA